MQKTRSFNDLVVWFFLVSSASNLVAQSGQANSAVHFRMVQKYLIVVPVRVNGEGPFDFLLDMGTNTTLISQDLARRLRLRPVDRVEIVTMAGSQNVPLSRLHSVTLGSKTVANVEVLFSELSAIQSVDSRICGVLGQNFLSQFNYILDYRERRIEFERDRELRDQLFGTPLRMTQEEGKPMITLQTESLEKGALRFVLDSAIASVVLFEPGSAGVDIQHNTDSWVNVETNAGSTIARLGLLRSLKIGSETFNDLPVAIMRNRASVQRRFENGLLPLRLFRAVYFDNKQGFVILNPRVQRLTWKR